jgi:hypothetical protein
MPGGGVLVPGKCTAFTQLHVYATPQAKAGVILNIILI